jgi:hypothetical protein
MKKHIRKQSGFISYAVIAVILLISIAITVRLLDKSSATIGTTEERSKAAILVRQAIQLQQASKILASSANIEWTDVAVNNGYLVLANKTETFFSESRLPVPPTQLSWHFSSSSTTTNTNVVAFTSTVSYETCALVNELTTKKGRGIWVTGTSLPAMTPRTLAVGNVNSFNEAIATSMISYLKSSQVDIACIKLSNIEMRIGVLLFNEKNINVLA